MYRKDGIVKVRVFVEREPVKSRDGYNSIFECGKTSASQRTKTRAQHRIPYRNYPLVL